jgi:hypothetical protein
MKGFAQFVNREPKRKLIAFGLIAGDSEFCEPLCAQLWPKEGGGPNPQAVYGFIRAQLPCDERKVWGQF